MYDDLRKKQDQIKKEIKDKKKEADQLEAAIKDIIAKETAKQKNKEGNFATGRPKRMSMNFSKIETGSLPLDVKISIPKDYVPFK